MTPIDEHDDMTTTAVLSTKGLILIPITLDCADYSAWLNDPEVVKFSELRHKTHTYENCQEYIRGFDQIDNRMWTINVVGANMHIGNITLHIDRHNNVGQMGMLIGEKWAWGRKYGREAWGAVMEWAKLNKIRRLEASCMLSNNGMVNVAKKAGMEHVTNLGGHFLRDGKPETMATFTKVYE